MLTPVTLLRPSPRKLDRIEQRGSKYVVLSMAGKVLGTYGSKAEATKRLQQIEIAKHTAHHGDAVPSLKSFRRDFTGPIKMFSTREKAMDAARAGINVAHFTRSNFLHVDGVLTRDGVFLYRSEDGDEWGELRTIDEIKRALPRFRTLPGTNDHPDEFVTRETCRDLIVGWNGDAYIVRGPDTNGIDRNLVRSKLAFFDDAMIGMIEDGKVQLSMGYWQTPIEYAGTDAKDGLDFRIKQTEMDGNHWSCVDLARGGPICSIEIKAAA